MNIIRNEDKGFKNGIARVIKGNKYAFIKTDGTIIGNRWFQYAGLFSK